MRSFLFIGVFLCFFTCLASAQRKEGNCPHVLDSVTKKLVFTFVDKMPEPIGGQDKMLRYISKNLKPDSADLSTRIIVGFIIEKDGNIDGGRIIKDNSSRRITAKRLLDLLKMVKWIPGSCNRKNVAVLYELPMTIDYSDQ